MLETMFMRGLLNHNKMKRTYLLSNSKVSINKILHKNHLTKLKFIGIP